MVKTGHECQLSAYMLLLSNLAVAWKCCFSQVSLVSLNALLGVLHAEWSTKRTTEPDTAQTERVVTRLVDTTSLDSRLHLSSKRVSLHNICVLTLFRPALSLPVSHAQLFVVLGYTLRAKNNRSSDFWLIFPKNSIFQCKWCWVIFNSNSIFF